MVDPQSAIRNPLTATRYTLHAILETGDYGIDDT